MAAKAVIRDVGRVLGHPYGFVDRISKLIPPDPGMTLEKAFIAEPQLPAMYDADEEVKALIDMARKLQRPVDDGQRTQTQEVELHQAGIFHIIFIELSYRELPMLIAIERRKIGDLRWRNDHAARMFTGVRR